jgi:hypothetical protein
MQADSNGTNSFVIKGSSVEVDTITKNLIKNKYTIEDELGILRKTLDAFINKRDIPSEFLAYNDYVNQIVLENKKLKPENN